jgi:hypothetical protein
MQREPEEFNCSCQKTISLPNRSLTRILNCTGSQWRLTVTSHLSNRRLTRILKERLPALVHDLFTFKNVHNSLKEHLNVKKRKKIRKKGKKIAPPGNRSTTFWLKVSYRGRDTVATRYNAYMAIFNTKFEITNSTLFFLFLDMINIPISTEP